MPYLTGIVTIEDDAGTRIDTPTADGTYQPITLVLGDGITGATTAQTSGLTKVRIIAGGVTTSLTEPGAHPSTSGWINLIAASAGIYGGKTAGGESPLLRWNGTSLALQLGDATDVNSVQAIAAVQFHAVVAGQERVKADATSSIVASPDGTSSTITVADGDIATNATSTTRVKIGGTTLIEATTADVNVYVPNGTLTAQFANAGTTIGSATNTPDVEVQASGRIGIVLGASDRIVVNTSKTTASSPDGSASIEVKDSGAGTGITFTGNAAFFGGTPVARASAYTQTYSTATRTNNFAQTVAYTGQDNLQAGNVYAKSADLENLRQAVENLAKLINAAIDDLQGINISG